MLIGQFSYTDAHSNAGVSQAFLPILFLRFAGQQRED